MNDAIKITALGTACLVGLLILFYSRRKPNSIIQKLNSIMSLLDELKAESADLKIQVAGFQTAIDKEQEQVAALLAKNAETESRLNTVIIDLEAQLAAAQDPAALQGVIDEIRSAKSDLALSKADLEGTVADEPGEDS